MFSRTFLLDAAERVFWTYVQALLGLLLVSGVTSLDALQSAAIAAIPAALAALKAIIATRFGDPESAALGRME
jgi:choline-glycine betaine transporter